VSFDGERFVEVVLAIIGPIYDLFSRSVAGGLAAILALYIGGLCVWLTARELSRPV
jgi:hypothetical protein